MKKKRTAWNSWILAVLALIWLCTAPVLAEGASGDNSLSSLGITTEGVTVSPEFYYSTIEYQVTVPGGTARLELEPVTSNSGASIVSIEGQDIGEDGTTTVVITVAAENGNQCGYYLYVKTDPSVQAVGTAVQTETESETEPQTEPQTEPETEDPRYVKVDRSSLEEAENTISTLKMETSNYRDRVTLLTRILYGMIGLCVILLFVVINLILKKKDLKSELQEYRGYGLPESGAASMDAQGYAGEESAYADDGYSQGAPYAGGDGYEQEAPYAGGDEYGQKAPYAGGDSYGQEAPYAGGDGYGQKAPYAGDDYGQSTSYADPASVPKPSKAKKKAKQMPQYQSPEPEHQYQAPKEKTKDSVEVNMIDL